MTTAMLDRAAGADLLLSDYLDHVAGLELVSVQCEIGSVSHANSFLETGIWMPG